MDNPNFWYIKTEQGIRGPFPTGQISQMVLLGRVTLDDEVSHDKQAWEIVRKIDALIPDVFKTSDDSQLTERVDAARRWADERREERRHEQTDERRIDKGRRVNETNEERASREKRELAYKSFTQKNRVSLLPISFMLIVIAGVIYFTFANNPVQTKLTTNCQSEIQPKLNWNNCVKSGLVAIKKNMSGGTFNSADFSSGNFVGSDLSNSNLNYADLSGANLRHVSLYNSQLKGSNLQGADLSLANLRKANLQYANLQNSNILEANIEGADVSFAIWFDGKKCRKNSISICK